MDKGDTSSPQYLEAFFKSKALNKACDLSDQADGIKVDTPDSLEKEKKEFFNSLPPKVLSWVKKHNKKLDLSVDSILNNL